MKALILAGGTGTRLRPYTTVLPKPLMPVGDYPILEIILRQLRLAGVTEVTLAVGYMGQIFEALFGDGKRLGMKVSYSFEERALGTAGAIASVIDQMGEDFIVMNGDLLTTLKVSNVFDWHRKAGATATIATYRREVKVDFGVIETSSQQALERYVEKPVYHFDVSMGINVFNAARIKPFLTEHEYLDIPTLMMQLKDAGEMVKCYQEPCYWLDIGRVDDYQTAVETFEARKSEFLGSAAAEI